MKQNYDESNQSLESFQFSYLLDNSLEEAKVNTLLDYRFRFVLNPSFYNGLGLEIDKFHFPYKEIELFSIVWFPQIFEDRSAFTDEAISEFSKRLELLKDSENFTALDINSIEKDLNIYCSNVENNYLNYEDIQKIPKYDLKYLDSFHLFNEAWDPNKISRNDFISKALEESVRSYNQFKEIAPFIKLNLITEFKNKLSLYGDKVEKSLPANFKKTPTKHNDELHFQWLIDYQVSPTKSYKQIFEEIVSSKSVSISAIKKGIERLVSELGISLRAFIKSGRPKGIKESKKRHRVQQ